MDAKLLLLKETFESEFSVERFERWTKEFFNKVQIIAPYKKNINYLSEFAFHIAAHSHVADFTDSDKNKIAVLAVELRRGRSVERARSMQRNFISKLISGNVQYDAAIVAFYCEAEPMWRLSLVRLDKEFLAGGKIKTSITPAKRFSYLVGEGEPCRTAMDQLYPIFQRENFNPTLDRIEEAFSVEAVTKEFFDKYREEYCRLKDYLDNNEQFIEEATAHEFTSEQFAKKLMGQLAFLYFLQKKGWLGVKVVPHVLNEKEYKNAFFANKASKVIIPKVYKQTGGDTYRLQPSVLAGDSFTDGEADVLAGCFKAESWDSGTKTFIRDIFEYCLKQGGKNFFEDYLEPFFYEALRVNRGENHYYKRLNCKIPFLNGGLFDPIKNYEWDRARFDIPNELFSNRHIKGERDADGILDVFERYNFTMNEDEPLEREVAVDPEMLGKIFENLLDIKDRKSKGAFYTPREIVHYMCQESLCNYLVNEVDLPYDEVKDFIQYGEIRKDEDCSNKVDLEDDSKRSLPRNIYINLANIDDALANIKVADPAVGSGAFPLGMLSEIVKLRNIITEYRVQQIPVDKKFERKMEYHNRNQYKIKWETIKNSIFAVDIESSAVDIAKLRLWLSLVVDQEVNTGDKTDPYFANDDINPHPLPNLDYNIMCGNSLVDEFEGIKLFDEGMLNPGGKSRKAVGGWQTTMFDDQMDVLTNILFSEHEKFFEENDAVRKEKIKANINQTIDAIIRAKLSRDNNNEGLARYEASLKEKTKPYFLWKLEFAKVFKENGGFDVVLGNPPYVDSENMVRNMPEFRELCNKKYLSAKGNWDLFVLFVEIGYILANTKGIVSFIIPNKIIAADYAKSIRAAMSENSISEIRDYSNVNVFKEAAVYPITFLSNKSKTNTFVRMVVMKEIEQVAWTNDVALDIFNQKCKWDSFLSENNEVVKIIDKMLLLPSLAEVSDVRGAATVAEAYEIKELLTDGITHSDKYFKFINTGTIDRYVPLWFEKKTQYIKQSYHRPVISKFALKAKYPKRHREGESEKIIIGGMTKILECVFDNGEYLAGKSTTIVLKKDIELKFILGLLNSVLLSKFYKVYFKSLSLAGGFYRVGAPQIKLLPIPIPSELQEKRITVLVNQVLSSKQDNPTANTSAIEAEIDKTVYELYGLTAEEIMIVEAVR